MVNIAASNTILAFKEYFSTWGLPNSIVTDNGPTFTSGNFKNFLINNNVVRYKTAPYDPASNGAAENAVRSFKGKFKVLIKGKMSRQEALVRYLFYYRTTPHSTTGRTPAELHVGRQLRTRSTAKSTVKMLSRLTLHREPFSGGIAE